MRLDHLPLPVAMLMLGIVAAGGGNSGVEANLATPFGCGEFVIWHPSPGVKVGMDGCRETEYSDSIYQSYRSFRVGAGDWRRWLDGYRAEAALVMAESPPHNLLALHPRLAGNL